MIMVIRLTLHGGAPVYSYDFAGAILSDITYKRNERTPTYSSYRTVFQSAHTSVDIYLAWSILCSNIIVTEESLLPHNLADDAVLQ